MRTYTIPKLGHYTKFFVKAFRDLGLNVVHPPSVSSETNQHGILNSVEMMCWPYKATLGTLIKAIEDDTRAGTITDVITYSSQGQCRFRHYGNLYDLALSNLGHDIGFHIVRSGNIIRDIRRITGSSFFKVWRVVINTIKEIKRYEEEQEKKFAKGDMKILLIGEIYTLLEPDVNFNLRQRLLDLGAGSRLACTLSAFINSNVRGRRVRSAEAAKYIDKKVGGHGFQNIVHVLEEMHEVDGIIYVFPLSCMPEATVLPIIEHICKKNKKPILKIEIDDNSSELNILTRLEAFTETIRISKGITGNAPRLQAV
ncbi:MAG: 2-hydroxyacyl-CoA dehydratase [Thermodesulfobacteriota bacterium]